MRRRDFLRTGAVVGITTAIAGCNTSNDSSDQNTPTDTSTPTSGSEGQTPQDTETQTESEEQQTEADPENAVRYFFEDETGALGHLGDDETPENYDHTITNSTTEGEYQELQRNDRSYAEDAASSQTAPNGEGLDMTVDEMVRRAEEIYNDPETHLDTERAETLGIDLLGEDEEILFTRALIKASQEAGVDSSGLANIVVSNMAEDAVEQIQPGFSNFKLSTLPATEAINPSRQGHAGGVRETEFGDEYGNSGFRHMAGLLQYENNGTNIKYGEQTDAVDETPTFFQVFRNPEDSIYRADLDQDTVNTTGGGNGIRFSEHYVTALDYTKARELESEESVLRFNDQENDQGGISGFGDYVALTLYQLVDDMGITGYDNNQDMDIPNSEFALDGNLVSDEFGESLEDFVINPSNEEKQYIENIARGMYQIQQQEGWGTSLALTGTIEDPEILPTNQATVNAVREDQAYSRVRERVAG